MQLQTNVYEMVDKVDEKIVDRIDKKPIVNLDEKPTEKLDEKPIVKTEDTSTDNPVDSKQEDQEISDRLQNVLFNKLTNEQICELYKVEFALIKLLFEKYSFTNREQQLISGTTYKKVVWYNYWLVYVNTDVKITRLREFLLEYFNLKLHNGSTLLQQHLCQFDVNQEYTFRCSNEILDKLVIPLTMYYFNYVEPGKQINYMDDIKKYHTIKFNSDTKKYAISFPFDKISNYQEYYNINHEMIKELNNPEFTCAVATDEQLKKAYANKTFIDITIPKDFMTQTFLNNIYIPKFTPSKEQLFGLLTNN